MKHPSDPEPFRDTSDRLPSPSSRPEAPARPGDEVLAALRPRGGRGTTAFERATRGGYVRTVSGGVAHQAVPVEDLPTTI